MLLPAAVSFVEVNWLTGSSNSTPLQEILSTYAAKLMTYTTEKIVKIAQKDATQMIEPTIGATEPMDAMTSWIEVMPETTGTAFGTTAQKLDAMRVVARMVRTKVEKTHWITKAMIWTIKTVRIPTP
jgi:hypothetical protein